MSKEYDELANCDLKGISNALWSIAWELGRKNDLLEIDMLCKTADAIRAAAKGSLNSLHNEGFIMAEELTLLAHKKITSICGLPESLYKNGDNENGHE